jgi:ABC-type uncharacterized transport system fused permease/ATPase subunit
VRAGARPALRAQLTRARSSKREIATMKGRMTERTALQARFKVGDHVRVSGSHLCGSVCSVLRWPQVTAYGVLYDDHAPQHLGEAPSAVYIERQLVPA